jgi:DNA excision repair protein ERCC-8
MNPSQSLLDRSLSRGRGTAFWHAQHARLIESTQLRPDYRFDGGEAAPAAPTVDELRGGSQHEASEEESGQGQRRIWAHQAGVNSLAVEKFDERW